MPFPPPSSTFKIFDTLPPANAATFQCGLPSTTTGTEQLSIIMYSPNLQMLISLDNTGSEAESSYSSAVTTGFTFSTTQSISIATSVGVNIEIVTASVTVTFALSFTEEWSTSTTKTITFNCPAGKKAFVYQGTLMSRILSFNSGTGAYTWYTAPAKALTEVLVTRNTPIGLAPSNPVTITPSASVQFVKAQ